MARKKQNGQLTHLELEIMQILWERGQSTVQQVKECMPKDRNLAYNTVQTMLNVLYQKGKVKRTLKDRAYYYQYNVSRQQVISSIMNDTINRLFGGSAENLVIGLLETQHLTAEKIRQLNKYLDDKSKETGNGND
jgi:predicted transcriptional regulator